MKFDSHIATAKTTGESYRYLLKISWQTRYYSCEMNNSGRVWFKSLSEAKAEAERKGTLVKVVCSRPELRDVIVLLEHAGAHIQTQVAAINQLPGDLTEDEIATRNNLCDATDFLTMLRSQVAHDLAASFA